MKVLSDLYRKKYKKIKTVGIGDSENDFQMLDSVDIPFLVMKKNKKYASKKYKKAGGIGPEGWNRVIDFILGEEK